MKNEILQAVLEISNRNREALLALANRHMALLERLADEPRGEWSLLEADEDEDPQERAEAIADLLLAVYGEEALLLMDDDEDEAEDEGEVLESLLEAWNPDDHPRGKGGKFIAKNSPEAVAATKDAIRQSLKQPRSTDTFQDLMGHLNLLTTRQIRELQQEYGVSAGGRVKAELVKKIAKRLDVGRRGEDGIPEEGDYPSYDEWAAGEREKNRRKAERAKQSEPPETLSDAIDAGYQKTFMKPFKSKQAAVDAASHKNAETAIVKSIIDGKLAGWHVVHKPESAMTFDDLQRWSNERAELINRQRGFLDGNKESENAEDWQIPLRDYFGIAPHKIIVEKALASGKPVPPEVLADYPDLAEKYGQEQPAPVQPKAKDGPHTMTKQEYVSSKVESAKKKGGSWMQVRDRSEAAKRQAEKEWEDATEKAYIAGEKTAEKPGWAKTGVEWANHPAGPGPMTYAHKKEVESALASGKPVPPEVLADYPDLAEKYGTPSDPLQGWSVNATMSDRSTAEQRQQERERNQEVYKRLAAMPDEEARKVWSEHPQAKIFRYPADEIDKYRESGPQEGDRNAEGLVFRDGRWRREEEEQPANPLQGWSVNATMSDRSTAEQRQQERERNQEVYKRLAAMTDEEARKVWSEHPQAKIFRYPADEVDKYRESGPQEGDRNAERLVFWGGRWRREEEEQPTTNEVTNEEPTTDRRQLEPERPDSGNVNAGIRGEQGGQYRTPRILTDRESLTAPADTARIPENLQPHLNEAQQQGVARVIESIDTHGGHLLADGTGVGKTRQLLASAQYYADQGKKVVIVAPAEVIKPNWKKGVAGGSYAKDGEIMGVDVNLTKGSEAITPGQVHLTTYNEIGKLKDQVDGDTIVLFDESHALKNANSKRGKDGRDISFKAGGVLYATATPADKPLHIAHLIRAGVFGGGSQSARKFFGKSEDTYRQLGLTTQEVRNPYTGDTIKKWVIDKSVGAQEVQRRIAGLFDQMTKEGLMTQRSLSMDNVTSSVDNVALPPEAAAEVEQAYKRAKANADGNEAVAIMAMRRAQEPHKIPATVDHVKNELAAGRAPIIFLGRVNDSADDEDGDGGSTPDENTARMLKDALIQAGIPEEDIGELHGAAAATADKKRRAMTDFNSGKKKLLISTLQSGGTGVNLDDTTGDRPRTVIMMTPPLSANDMVQGVGRINRLSTKSDAKVMTLVSDHPIDQWNMKLLQRKMGTLGAINAKNLAGDTEGADTRESYQWPRQLTGEKPQEKPASTPEPTGKPLSVNTRKVNTKRGERHVASFQPTKAFWNARPDKKTNSSVSVRKNPYGEWEVTIWGDSPQHASDVYDEMMNSGFVGRNS